MIKLSNFNSANKMNAPRFGVNRDDLREPLKTLVKEFEEKSRPLTQQEIINLKYRAEEDSPNPEEIGKE